MKITQVLFRNKGARVWFIVTMSVIAFLLVLTILASTVFYSLISTVLGGERRITGDGEDSGIYKSDYATKEEAYNAANELNERVNEEGIVLLKNEDNALPIKSGEKVNVFGKNSVNLVYGGSGSGAGSTEDRRTLFESLTAAGIEYNEDLKNFYEDDSRSGEPRTSNPPIETSGVIYLKTGETPVENYQNDSALMASCQDEEISTALVVFSRIGGEGSDLPRTMESKTEGVAMDGANVDDHYLQLDNNERALLKMIAEMDNIEHIIVIINSSTSMELGFLDDIGHYAYQDKIDGALWIGGPGNSGIMALGRVLTGEVNPSGRLVDTYVRDFTLDPTYVNFSDNMLVERKGRYTFTGDQYMKTTSSSYPYYFVDYEEGVYVGYRYWETRGFTEGEGTYSDNSIKGTTTSEWDSWYDAHVVYPFGYGLSYTTFDWEITNKSELNGAELTKDKITLKVKVTNTGDYAGKDVVEVYATAPYTSGGIEKPHKVLVGFAKTPVLYPAAQASEDNPDYCELEIEIDPYDFASYDYNDANKNGFKGYELESGNYTLWVSANAHTAEDYVTLELGALLNYDKDPVTGTAVVNRFDDADDQLSDVTVNGETRKGLSRSDWEGTWPTSHAAYEARIVDEAFISQLESADSHNEDAKNYTMPEQAASGAEGGITLREMYGVEYTDEKWDEFMNQLAASDMLNMVNNGNFQSPAILYAGKPATLESDGPVGFVNFMEEDNPLSQPKYYQTCSYASECVMGATWNVDLIREVGKSIGNEGLHGNERGDGAPYSGLYAPGANIHRSPFSGRNFEYFSEDGYLSGMLAASEIAGAKEMGVYMYIKHFAVNDQETHRDSNGLVTWVTEQAMRELYFRPFEKAVKVGGTTGVMSSFNRIGTTWTGGDYRLLTNVLREEWGFNGTVICDFNLSVYMNAEQMFYAGGDLNLTTMPNNHWNADTSDAADMYVLRRAAKNIMYTVANSNAINDMVVGYKLPVWTIALIVIDCVVVAGLAVWGFFAIRKSVRSLKASAKQNEE